MPIVKKETADLFDDVTGRHIGHIDLFGREQLTEDIGAQPATWYAGEVASTITPTIVADGDLTSATDQVPLLWRAVINADNDVDAAQRLMDGTPNVIELLPATLVQLRNLGADGLAETIESIHVLCISSAAVPANYTGGAYILSSADTDIANALTMMARVDISTGLGCTYARLLASATYNTNYSQLSVAFGVEP